MSFITKKHIKRRTFLQGAGATLALPVLEAMIPATTAAAQTAAGQAKPRFVGVFYPHGMAPGFWEPKAEGALTDNLPVISQALAKVIAEPQVRQRLTALGLAVEFMSAEQLASRERAYAKTWGDIIRKSGFQPQ